MLALRTDATVVDMPEAAAGCAIGRVLMLTDPVSEPALYQTLPNVYTNVTIPPAFAA